MRGVIVRPANTADGEAIGSILNALLLTTAIEWTDTAHTADSILEWLDEHETVLVAEEGGEVVGVAAFGWFRDVTKRPGYRFTVGARARGPLGFGSWPRAHGSTHR
jgi:L-amino acid N-acyltransferase YncA